MMRWKSVLGAFYFSKSPVPLMWQTIYIAVSGVTFRIRTWVQHIPLAASDESSVVIACRLLLNATIKK